MAEGLMRAKIEEHGLQDKFTVSSAGVAASAGAPASIETRQLLLEHGINSEDYRSTQVTKYLMDESDYVFCLSSMHQDAITRPHPEYREKTLLVGEFLGESQPRDIADPFGLGPEAYKVVEAELLNAVDNILSFVQENTSDSLE